MRHIKNTYCFLLSVLLISMITTCQNDDEPSLSEVPQRFLEKTTNGPGAVAYESYVYEEGFILQKKHNGRIRSDYSYEGGRLSEVLYFQNASSIEPWFIVTYEYPGNQEVVRREQAEGRSAIIYEHEWVNTQEYIIRQSGGGLGVYERHFFIENGRVVRWEITNEVAPGVFVDQRALFSYDKPVRNPLFGLQGENAFEEQWLPTKVVNESKRAGEGWVVSSESTYEYDTDANNYPEKRVMRHWAYDIAPNENTILYHYYD